MTTPKIGDVVRIVFDDHSEDLDSLIRFEVFGRLTKKTRSVLTVHSWCYEDRAALSDDNCKTFNIARKLIVGVEILSPNGYTPSIPVLNRP